jgi:ligand-binding sensor domain-containing protein/AraC-like DNA-binding protein
MKVFRPDAQAVGNDFLIVRGEAAFSKMTAHGRRLSRLWLVSLFLAAMASRDLLALDPTRSLKDYLVRTWTVETGLPNGRINALAPSAEGYLWIGTSAGLVRFDGVRFTAFTRKEIPALKKDNILALYEDTSGVLWIGTDGGGLVSLDGGEWKARTTENGLSNDRVRTISGDGKGGIWAGTDYGLNHIGPDGTRVYTPDDGLYDSIITALAADSRGNLWIGTLRGGLQKFRDGTFRAYGFADGLESLFIHSLAANPDGNVWIGTQEGLYLLRPEAEGIRPIPGAMSVPVSSLGADERGALWIGTMADGLKRKTGRTLSGLAAEDGLPDNFVTCLLPDHSGSLWVGTETGGLVQLKEAPASSITMGNGLPESAVQAVMQDRAGFLWVATRHRGLCRIKDGKVVENVARTAGLPADRIQALLEDQRGGLWIGTQGSGLYGLQSGRASRLDLAGDLPSADVTALLLDHQGALWIGTENGLKRWPGGAAEHRHGPPDLPGRSIRVLRQSRTGVFYVGAKDGLYRFSETAFVRIFPALGDSDIDVLSLYEDKGGALWIGTNGHGLIRWQDGTAVSYTLEAGLYDDTIFSLTGDRNGNLWLGTANGVLRIGRQEIGAGAGRKPVLVHAALFDEADGMASRQCLGFGQPSCWRTDADLIFFPTVKGVAVFDPGRMPASPEAPGVVIEDVRVGNRSLVGREGGSYRAAGKIIEFRFTGFDFTAPEKIRFSCRLEGGESGDILIPPRGERIARFVGLNPGRYRFFVTAIGNLGSRNESGAVFAFKIPTPFIKNPFFYGAAGLAVLASLGAGVYSRSRRRARKARKKYKTSSLGPELAEKIAPQLLRAVEEEKLFLNPSLSLRDLAQRLRTHPNHLSRVINEKFGLSFNDFINRYRIDEAKRRLADPEERDASILDIALESGFFSKSVFNTAFKKFSGTTPSEFKKRNSRT